MILFAALLKSLATFQFLLPLLGRDWLLLPAFYLLLFPFPTLPEFDGRADSLLFRCQFHCRSHFSSLPFSSNRISPSLSLFPAHEGDCRGMPAEYALFLRFRERFSIACFFSQACRIFSAIKTTSVVSGFLPASSS